MARYESWASVEFSIIKIGEEAKIVTLIRACSYSDTLEKELVRGAGRDVLGTTDPVYVPGDMSLEFLFKFWRAFIADVTGNGATKLGDHDFRMVLKHLVRGSTDAPMVDELDFSITGNDDSKEQGPAALVTIVPCMLTKVKRNGVEL
jgi:hypothetical protein